MEAKIGISGCAWLQQVTGVEPFQKFYIGASSRSPFRRKQKANLSTRTRYRQNPAVFRASRWGSTFINGFDSLKEKIQSKYTTLKEPGAFPSIPPRWSRQLETVSWTAPYDALLAHHSKTIMMVIPWLYVGGADIGALHMIQLYAEAGYRVTVLCTLYKAPEGVELRPEVLKWTHDVHVMPSFLRANDFPRYIKHLVESRGIEDVIFSNSQLIYEMLPALVEQLPQVKFVDVSQLYIRLLRC